MGGFFEDLLYDNPQFNFDDALEHAVSQFPIEFKAYFGVDSEYCPEHLDTDDWERYNRLYRNCIRLALAAKELVRPKRLPNAVLTEYQRIVQEALDEETTIRELLKKTKNILPKDAFKRVATDWWTVAPGDARMKRAFFETCMQIHAVDEFFTWPDALATRMIRLLNFLVKADGPGTRLYLARVAECYIRDMRCEFAIMSRAVLEEAITEIIDPKEAARILDDSAREPLGLKKLINVAHEPLGVLDDKSAQAAHEVRVTGDRAVHDQPVVEPDPENILSNLTLVLEALQRHSRPEAN